MLVALLGAQLEVETILTKFIQVDQHTPRGTTIYKVEVSTNWTVVFVWDQPINGTARQLFRLHHSSGALSVGENLGGHAGEQYNITVGVYCRDGEGLDSVTVFPLSLLITQNSQILCRPRSVHMTVRETVPVDSGILTVYCKVTGNESVPLIYSLESNPSWQGLFRIEPFHNSSQANLVVNCKLHTVPDGEKNNQLHLKILVYTIGDVKLNTTVHAFITLLPENSTMKDVVCCSNATVTVITAADFSQPVDQLCMFSPFAVNSTVRVLFDAGLPLFISNRVIKMSHNTSVAAGIFLVSLNATTLYGNVIHWTLTFLTVHVTAPVQVPYLQPASKVVFINENTAYPSLVHTVKAINYPPGGIDFYFKREASPSGNN